MAAEPVPGPADRCPETRSSLVEHEEVVEYPTFTSLTEAWCENPLASMPREGFCLPLQSYSLPKSYAKSLRQNSANSATDV
eukprot:3354825-Rhodomonas_salina.1